MKTIILLLFLALASCSKDSPNEDDPTFTLPPETQIGANTFGVTINGKVYIPRDPTGSSWGGIQTHGITFTGLYPQPWYEIIVIDGASSVGFKMVVHFKDLFNMNNGFYPLAQSNFRDNIDSIEADHIYFKIWDSAINNYAYYGSVENLGEVKVTRRDNGILSGNFKGKFARYGNPDDVITLTDGRFDLNLNTINNHVFP